MKIDFEKIIGNLTKKAADIYSDKDKIWDLLAKTKDKIQSNPEVNSILDDVKLVMSLIKDHSKGRYRDLSKGSIVLVIISLIYLINPMDLIPDFIIGGFIDDAAVIAYILKKISVEVEAYKKWKGQDGDIFEAAEEDYVVSDDMDESSDDILNEEKSSYEDINSGFYDNMIDITRQ